MLGRLSKNDTRPKLLYVSFSKADTGLLGVEVIWRLFKFCRIDSLVLVTVEAIAWGGECPWGENVSGAVWESRAGMKVRWSWAEGGGGGWGGLSKFGSPCVRNRQSMCAVLVIKGEEWADRGFVNDTKNKVTKIDRKSKIQKEKSVLL